MTATFITQIEIDPEGVAWIQGANTKVVEIVMDKIAHGWTPDEMHLQHPHLSLAQIHAALTYYYEHQAALDAEIQARQAGRERMLAEVSDPQFRQRLENLRRP